jgi:type IV pilus assembly protein PilX
MLSQTGRVQPRSLRRPQRGAALFVGLMVLILLALLGLSGMQAALLQERMAGNFLTSNLAFQRAEEELRDVEAAIQQITNANGLFPVEAIGCGFLDTTSVATFAKRDLPGGANWTGLITNCIPGWSVEKPGDQSGRPVQVYAVVGKDSDRDESDVSISILESIYIP